MLGPWFLAVFVAVIGLFAPGIPVHVDAGVLGIVFSWRLNHPLRLDVCLQLDSNTGVLTEEQISTGESAGRQLGLRRRGYDSCRSSSLPRDSWVFRLCLTWQRENWNMVPDSDKEVRMRLFRALLLGGILCAFAPFAVDGARGETSPSFDADVLFVDGRTETVTDVWEYYQRQPVRELCYIDGSERPHILYSEIVSIGFAEWGEDKRKTTITVTLKDDTVREGLLWDNDSFYATREDGTEWRGRIESLKEMAFRPSHVETEQGGEE
jgi:hypothetical protein